MQSIDSKTTGNDYTSSCTLSEIWSSNGGYFTVDANDVFMQLQWGQQGTLEWTNEVHVPVGNGLLNPGTVGVRFRSYAAGKAATVTAALAGQAEPAIQIGTPSTATVMGVLSGITGRIKGSDGSTLGGTGFTCARTAAGLYTVTYTVAFSVPPTVGFGVMFGPSEYAIGIQAGGNAAATLKVEVTDLTGAFVDPTEFDFAALTTL